MQVDEVIREATLIRGSLIKDSNFARSIDIGRDYIPVPKVGTGDIKLVIVGQDPTVKNEKSRDLIKAVLNLDKKNSLYEYLSHIASQLGCDIEKNTYATNLLKCFYIAPPATLQNVVREHTPLWIGLLLKELSAYPDAQIITLGEPVLDALVTEGSRKVRDYWGYIGHNLGDKSKYRFCDANNNLLKRRFFPFPHQPSIRKEFYHRYMEEYIRFTASFRQP